jgi:hypothetical protein
MEITEKKTIETKRETTLPAYFKDDYSIYRIYEIEKEILVDVIHNWDKSSGHELLIQKPYTQFSWCTNNQDATENDFNEALANFLNQADETFNSTHHDQGSDSFYHLHAQLLPLNPPEETNPFPGKYDYVK